MEIPGQAHRSVHREYRHPQTSRDATPAPAEPQSELGRSSYRSAPATPSHQPSSASSQLHSNISHYSQSAPLPGLLLHGGLQQQGSDRGRVLPKRSCCWLPWDQWQQVEQLAERKRASTPSPSALLSAPRTAAAGHQWQPGAPAGAAEITARSRQREDVTLRG